MHGWIQGGNSGFQIVHAIQELTNPENWKHIDGLKNPADMVTRGVSGDALVHSDLWWHGPSCLREAGESFPMTPIYMLEGDKDVEAELKKGDEKCFGCH